MKSLLEDIKNRQFKSVYLLYGVEDYLKRQCKQRLKTALVAADDTMNYACFEGKQADVKEIISLCDTVPFFSEKRLIVVEDSGFFKSKQEQLADYLKEIPASACLLFVENEVDKRGRLYKAVNSIGRAIELGRQDEKSLLPWIGAQVKREGKQIRESSARYLLERAGTDMALLEHELEKLFAYCREESEITRAAITAVVSAQLQNHIFEMVEAVSMKKQARALQLYYDLLALKEPPLRILFLLVRQFRLLYETKALMSRGLGKSQIAKAAGLHPFAAGKYMAQQKSFPASALREILEAGVELEKAVKSGDLSDRLSVELFIVQYAAA